MPAGFVEVDSLVGNLMTLDISVSPLFERKRSRGEKAGNSQPHAPLGFSPWTCAHGPWTKLMIAYIPVKAFGCFMRVCGSHVHRARAFVLRQATRRVSTLRKNFCRILLVSLCDVIFAVTSVRVIPVSEFVVLCGDKYDHELVIAGAGRHRQ